MTPLPGSSVGESTVASIKSESVTQGMDGSYYGSNRGSLGSRSDSNRSGGASGVALPSARTGSGSLTTLQYGGSARGIAPSVIGTSAQGAKSSSSSILSGYTSGHNHNSWSSKALSSEHGSATYFSNHPRTATGRPTRRDETWPLRAGSTLVVPEKRPPGYVAGSRARRRV